MISKEDEDTGGIVKGFVGKVGESWVWVIKRNCVVFLGYCWGDVERLVLG